VYFVTLTGGNDGKSKFGPRSARHGYFPTEAEAEASLVCADTEMGWYSHMVIEFMEPGLTWGHGLTTYRKCSWWDLNTRQKIDEPEWAQGICGWAF
jgi:hypothetical protein